MKLSKKFLEFIENENNEQGDILLAMIDEPENTREDISAVAFEFIVNSSEYDGNVLELHRYLAENILDDDDEDEDDDTDTSDDELTTLDILAMDVGDDDDEDEDPWNELDDEDED